MIYTELASRRTEFSPADLPDLGNWGPQQMQALRAMLGQVARSRPLRLNTDGQVPAKAAHNEKAWVGITYRGKILVGYPAEHRASSNLIVTVYDYDPDANRYRETDEFRVNSNSVK